MAYTAELITEVKALYPDNKKMHELAESGDAFLGRYLDDSCSSSIHIDTILSANSLAELQAKAKIMKRKLMLYHSWCKQDPRPKIGY